MSLMISSVTLIAAGVLFSTVASSPTTIDVVDTTQPFTDVLAQSKQDRASWCAAFEDAQLLRGNTCNVVEMNPYNNQLGHPHVHGIPEIGRVNTFLVKISAWTALRTLANFRDMVDTNALPDELELLVADPVESSPANGFDSKGHLAKGWKGRMRGKARLGESRDPRGHPMNPTDSMRPTYFVPFDLEHVPAPKGEEPITKSKIWFGWKLPDGRVKWPYAYIVVTWLHPSVAMPDEAVAHLNWAVENRTGVLLGYRPRRVKVVVDLEWEEGRCAEVRMGGSTEALPMEEGDYRGKAARVGMVQVDENAIELVLDCVLDQPSHEVFPVKIDFRY